MIPHWDFGWGWRGKTKLKLFIQASFDLTLGLILSFLIFGQGINPWYFLACILASISWDIAEIPYWFLNWRFPPFSSIYNFQSSMQGKTKTIFMGIVTQVVTVSVFVFILQKVH